MKVFCKEFITVWTRGLVRWLSRKFDSISIDLTPVEEKLDDVKSDVADVKTAVENIDFTPLAKEAQATLNKEAIITAVNNAQPDLSTVAKQGTNPNATNTAILAAFGDIDFSTLAKQGSNANATLTAILEALQGGDDPDIPEGVAERLAIIMQFFGLPEALPEIEVATEQEVKDINDDVMGALYGYGKVTVTIHSLMRIGTAQNSQSSQDSSTAQDSENAQNSEQGQDSENAQSYTTQDLASVVYVDPSKTWAENGYPTLYDDEGTAIDTTTNPAAGDEVFNYQIQSES